MKGIDVDVTKMGVETNTLISVLTFLVNTVKMQRKSLSVFSVKNAASLNI